MRNPVLHNGQWWQRSLDGQWFRWDVSLARWLPLVAAHESGFRSLDRLARAFITLVAIGLVVDVASIVWGVRAYRFFGAVNRGEFVDESEMLVAAGSVDRLGVIVAVPELVIFLTAGIVFIRWFHRAYSNLPALGVPDRRYRMGWAVGGWFTPFVNWFRPKQIHNDVWRASDPALPWPARRELWSQIEVPRSHTAWWVAFLLSGLTGWLATHLMFRATDLGALQLAAVGSVVADLLTMVSAALVIHVVLAVTTRQQVRASTRPQRPTPWDGPNAVTVPTIRTNAR